MIPIQSTFKLPMELTLSLGFESKADFAERPVLWASSLKCLENFNDLLPPSPTNMDSENKVPWPQVAQQNTAIIIFKSLHR